MKLTLLWISVGSINPRELRRKVLRRNRSNASSKRFGLR